MKSIFNPKTAMAIVAVAVTLSLMNFSDANYAPADLASSKAVTQRAALGAIIDPVPIPTTVLARQLALQRLLLTTTRFTVLQDYPPVFSYDKKAEKSVAKVIHVKMKALG